jgi:hypothetical protein
MSSINKKIYFDFDLFRIEMEAKVKKERVEGFGSIEYIEQQINSDGDFITDWLIGRKNDLIPISYTSNETTENSIITNTPDLNDVRIDLLLDELFRKMFSYTKEAIIANTKNELLSPKVSRNTEGVASINKGDFRHFSNYILNELKTEASKIYPKATGKLLNYIINSLKYESIEREINPGFQISYSYPNSYPSIFTGNVKHFGTKITTSQPLFSSEYYTPIVISDNGRTKKILLNDLSASNTPNENFNLMADVISEKIFEESINSLQININVIKNAYFDEFASKRYRQTITTSNSNYTVLNVDKVK